MAPFFAICRRHSRVGGPRLQVFVMVDGLRRRRPQSGESQWESNEIARRVLRSVIAGRKLFKSCLRKEKRQSWTPFPLLFVLWCTAWSAKTANSRRDQTAGAIRCFLHNDWRSHPDQIQNFKRCLEVVFSFSSFHARNRTNSHSLSFVLASSDFRCTVAVRMHNLP